MILCAGKHEGLGSACGLSKPRALSALTRLSGDLPPAHGRRRQAHAPGQLRACDADQLADLLVSPSYYT